MLMLSLICMIFGFVVFLIAAAGIGAGKVNLVALGLAAWLLAIILEHVK